MRHLDLRTRLLMAFGFIAALQIGVALGVVSVTRSHLIDQIDDRLAIAMPLDRGRGLNPPPPGLRGGADERPERLGDTYEGLLGADGSLTTVFAPNTTGTDLPSPEIDLQQIEAASGGPITVDAQSSEGAGDGGDGGAGDGEDDGRDEGDFRYRLSATGLDDGEFLITAIPLDGVDNTMSRLTTVVWVAVAVISVALAVVAWWMLQLGIAPIKRMTRSAEAIADGDLSERITEADQRTEAGQLGHALNTMLGRIETSFDERRRAEDKLRQFIADASHELRTPVATIRGYAELYQAGGLTEHAELDDAMRRTEQESQRMSRLIADMLGLAKLDRDPTFTTRPVDLAAIARDTVADAKVTHPERTISPTIPDSPVVVEGAEDLLRQALSNLVGNAIVHTDATAGVAVNVRTDGSIAVVEVIDDGEGMEPDVVARTTERFYRADPSRSRHQGGSGLGLAIADTVVNGHDGTLDIESAPGRGTTVTISLPFADA